MEFHLKGALQKKKKKKGALCPVDGIRPESYPLGHLQFELKLWWTVIGSLTSLPSSRSDASSLSPEPWKPLRSMGVNTPNYSGKLWGFPGGSVVKNPPANEEVARDAGLSPGSGRSLGEGNGNPLQYSCLENPVDRGA